VLPRQQFGGDDDLMKFLSAHVGKFDMYVEDEYAAFVRYCFEDPWTLQFSARASSTDTRASSSPAERVRTPSRGCGRREHFQEKWNPVFRPKMRPRSSPFAKTPANAAGAIV